MKMSCKGQGLSLSTIVIAVVVLIVLIILVAMTTGYFGNWRGNFLKISDTGCSAMGGTLRDAKDGCLSKEIQTSATEVPEGKICCKSESGEICQKVKGSRFWGDCYSDSTRCNELPGFCGSGKKCCEGNKPIS